MRPDPTHATDLPPAPIRRIVLATDLGVDAPQLFADSLGLAMRAHAVLTLVHVDDPARPEATWRRLPSARELLERWGRVDPSGAHTDLERLGVRVHTLEKPAVDLDLGRAVSRAVAELAPDLLVLGTSARTGLERLVEGSVAENVVQDIHSATLLVPHHARGLVHPLAGVIRLKRVLVPVTSAVPQQPVIDALNRLLAAVAPGPVVFRMVHVGTSATLPTVSLPARSDWMWKTELRAGALVEEIVDAALEHDADLVAMATLGHDGFLDAVRGSVMERVLRRSPCPVLAVRV